MIVELLMQHTNKVNPDAYRDPGCEKRGDVITIQREGWGWTQTELNNPDWRIIKLNLPVNVILSLLAPEEGEFAHRIARKRKYDIDVSAIPVGVQNTIRDSLGTVLDFSGVDIVAYVRQKGIL